MFGKTNSVVIKNGSGDVQSDVVWAENMTGEDEVIAQKKVLLNWNDALSTEFSDVGDNDGSTIGVGQPLFWNNSLVSVSGESGWLGATYEFANGTWSKIKNFALSGSRCAVWQCIDGVMFLLNESRNGRNLRCLSPDEVQILSEYIVYLGKYQGKDICAYDGKIYEFDFVSNWVKEILQNSINSLGTIFWRPLLVNGNKVVANFSSNANQAYVLDLDTGVQTPTSIPSSWFFLYAEGRLLFTTNNTDNVTRRGSLNFATGNDFSNVPSTDYVGYLWFMRVKDDDTLETVHYENLRQFETHPCIFGYDNRTKILYVSTTEGIWFYQYKTESDEFFELDLVLPQLPAKGEKYYYRAAVSLDLKNVCVVARESNSLVNIYLYTFASNPRWQADQVNVSKFTQNSITGYLTGEVDDEGLVEVRTALADKVDLTVVATPDPDEIKVNGGVL